MSTEQMARRLTDIEEIKQLKARYFRNIDTKNWKGYRECFADDFKFFGNEDVKPMVVGGDEYVAWAARLYPVGGARTMHHGHNPEIEVTSERTATGIWSLGSRTLGADGKEETLSRGGATFYYEEYEKGSDGKWRIKQSRIRSSGPMPPMLK